MFLQYMDLPVSRRSFVFFSIFSIYRGIVAFAVKLCRSSVRKVGRKNSKKEHAWVVHRSGSHKTLLTTTRPITPIRPVHRHQWAGFCSTCQPFQPLRT